MSLSRSMLRLLGVLFVLLLFVNLVHLGLERFVEFLDMPDIGAEIAREVTEHSSRIRPRGAAARAYVDLARRLDRDSHVIFPFAHSRGVHPIERRAGRISLQDFPSAERVDRDF